MFDMLEIPEAAFPLAIVIVAVLAVFATPIVEFLKKTWRPLPRLLGLALVVLLAVFLIGKLSLQELLLVIAVVLLWLVHRDIRELTNVVRTESARHP
jgi:hypothetical protein